jgi:hypothetical protein
MMFQPILDFVLAHKEALILLLINEIVAINPKFASGSIGQLILNLLRGMAGKAPVSIPAPDQK